MRKIDALWTPPSPVKLVDFHRLIGDEARGLMRYALSQGWKLRPLDAIHLGTARFMGAAKLETYSRDFPRWRHVIGCEIGQPQSMNPQLST